LASSSFSSFSSSINRQKFPRLESKNVQFWFKNRRAKCKRLKMSLYDSPSQLASLNPFHGTPDREMNPFSMNSNSDRE
jgi:Homeodomain